jgi:hypothetical protein
LEICILAAVCYMKFFRKWGMSCPCLILYCEM